MKRIKRLATEGLAMTAVVMVGLIAVNVAANSGIATRLEAIPVLGTVVKGVQAASNTIVTPVSNL